MDPISHTILTRIKDVSGKVRENLFYFILFTWLSNVYQGILSLLPRCWQISAIHLRIKVLIQYIWYTCVAHLLRQSEPFTHCSSNRVWWECHRVVENARTTSSECHSIDILTRYINEVPKYQYTYIMLCGHIIIEKSV